MRFSVTFALLGMLMAGSHVLATPEISDDYGLYARTFDAEGLDARDAYDTYMDIAEREVFDDVLDEFFAREYYDQDLSERDGLDDLLDYVTREDDEGALQARYDFDELDEREFSDDEDEFVRRAYDFDDVELEAREPFRYRIGIVVQPHNN